MASFLPPSFPEPNVPESPSHGSSASHQQAYIAPSQTTAATHQHERRGSHGHSPAYLSSESQWLYPSAYYPGGSIPQPEDWPRYAAYDEGHDFRSKAPPVQPARLSPTVCRYPRCNNPVFFDRRVNEFQEWCSEEHMQAAMTNGVEKPCKTCGVRTRRNGYKHCSGNVCRNTASTGLFPEVFDFGPPTGTDEAAPQASAAESRLLAHMLGIDIPSTEPSAPYTSGYEWWPRGLDTGDGSIFSPQPGVQPHHGATIPSPSLGPSTGTDKAAPQASAAESRLLAHMLGIDIPSTGPSAPYASGYERLSRGSDTGDGSTFSPQAGVQPHRGDTIPSPSLVPSTGTDEAVPQASAAESRLLAHMLVLNYPRQNHQRHMLQACGRADRILATAALSRRSLELNLIMEAQHIPRPLPFLNYGSVVPLVTLRPPSPPLRQHRI